MKLAFAILALLACGLLTAKRGEFLNSTGNDGRFHLRPDMYLCLNFSFYPGDNVRDEGLLKGELLFSGYDGNDDLDKADACVRVTQKMIDRQNKILDAMDGTPPMKAGESRTFRIK